MTSLRHLVVVGLMGSGKTTVGRLVATALGWPMTDSDRSIEAGEGRTARVILQEDGADVLHALERRHLHAALDEPGPSVICPAASVVDDDATIRALRDPELLVVWLTAEPATAAARFDNDEHRPQYGDNPLDVFVAQAAARGPRYRALGAVELATDARTPEDLAAGIVALVLARIRP